MLDPHEQRRETIHPNIEAAIKRLAALPEHEHRLRCDALGIRTGTAGDLGDVMTWPIYMIIVNDTMILSTANSEFPPEPIAPGEEFVPLGGKAWLDDTLAKMRDREPGLKLSVYAVRADDLENLCRDRYAAGQRWLVVHGWNTGGAAVVIPTFVVDNRAGE